MIHFTKVVYSIFISLFTEFSTVYSIQKMLFLLIKHMIMYHLQLQSDLSCWWRWVGRVSRAGYSASLWILLIRVIIWLSFSFNRTPISSCRQTQKIIILNYQYLIQWKLSVWHKCPHKWKLGTELTYGHQMWPWPWISGIKTCLQFHKLKSTLCDV